ncbi:MAG: helix-turn-helix domain-containing protein [Gammaproteobacteria bacterium]|nr:helix-turn-helix domain-containing protein [Gammaproteobacteria bacterium]
MLKTLRRARQRSQLDLAVSAGLTQKHVSFIETSRVCPGRTTLERLAQALKLPQSDRETLLAAAGYLPSTPTSPNASESIHARTAAMTQRLLAQQEPVTVHGAETCHRLTSSGFSQAVETLTSVLRSAAQAKDVLMMMNPSWDLFERLASRSHGALGADGAEPSEPEARVSDSGTRRKVEI